MSKRLWVLGSADPEMERIEKLLAECGEAHVYAMRGGERVRGGDAYRCDPVPGASHWVECESPGQARGAVIDHHRPGDPGYGRPPNEFLSASSIGQVVYALTCPDTLPEAWERERFSGHYCSSIAIHGYLTPQQRYVAVGERGQAVVVIPHDLVLAAAADHCLAHAYRGACPGVDPDDLMTWRAVSRASHQGRSAGEVLADVERAKWALREAPLTAVWADRSDCEPPPGLVTEAEYKDMRGRHLPELPEAAAREGLCFIADGLPDPDGRRKVVCQGGTPEQIRAFMEVWAPTQLLAGIYGDPERGIAGGYIQP